MKNILRYATACLLMVAGFHAAQADATVTIGGTRVVYPAQEREVTVKLSNVGTTPALVQVWMDDGDEKASPEEMKVPFTLAPPIFRMEAGKGQVVRMVYTKEPLPTDKETLFWLNVLEVPPKAANSEGRNLLQFAFRTRIKVFFRPANLPGTVEAASEKLIWKLVNGKDGKGYALQVTNPSPYYVNFASVGVKAGDRTYKEQGGGAGGMVAPGGSATFPVSDLTARPAGEAQAVFEVISDYGAVQPKQASLAS